jgi:hypothetical protein
VCRRRRKDGCKSSVRSYIAEAAEDSTIDGPDCAVLSMYLRTEYVLTY